MSLSIKKRTLRKVVSSITAITTIVWLSGVSMLAVPVASAAVVDGDLIKSNATNSDGTPTLESLDVYIVKLVGEKKFKRLILNPEVFNSYGHLSWDNIQTVSQSVMDEYTTSSLVRVDGDTKVYALAPDGDTGSKSWINLTAEDFLGEPSTDADSIYTINSTDAGNYTEVGQVTTVSQLTTFYANGTLPSTGEGETVALAADTPTGATIAYSAQNVEMAKINFSAGSSAYTVSSVAITRSGVSEDSDISAIKLYDGLSQLGSTQALNTTTHKATFTSLNWTIPANTTKTLTVKANIGGSSATGSVVVLGVASADDVTTTATALSGTYPINGNAMSIGAIGVGTLTVDAQTTPSGTIISGSTEQAVAAFKFTNTVEGFNVNSIKLTEVGSSVDSDMSNIKLMDGATQVGSTVASLVNGAVTFDLSSSPLYVKSGGSKTLTVYVDVSSNVTTSRQVQFEITQADDISAAGVNSGGGVTVSGTFPEQGAAITIGQGTLTVATSTEYVPSAQDYVLGQEQVLLNAFKFSAGATEGVRIAKLQLTLTGSSVADTDISNVQLYDAETATVTNNVVSGTPIAGPASSVSSVVTFGSNSEGLDVPGLFDIDASSNRHILVAADIPTGAAAAHDLGVKINNPTTNVKADGLTSAGDLSTSEINGGTTTSVPSTDLDHDLNANGTLSVAISGNTPAATTYSKGITGYEFAQFDFTATMEDMIISALNIDFSENDASTSYTLLSTDTDVTNIKIYKGSDLLATDASLSSGVASFNLNETVSRGTTTTLRVVGDIPSGSSSSTLTAWIGDSSGTDYRDNMTTTGASSGAAIDESGTAANLHGNLMTAGAPKLTASMADTPANKNVIKNGTEIQVATMYLSAAGSAEDIKVTKVRVSMDDADDDDITDETNAGSADFSNMRLKVDGSQIAIEPAITDGGTSKADYVTFSGLSLIIPKGGQKAVDIYVDVINNTSGTDTYEFGILAYTTTHFAGSGVSSGTALTDSTIIDGGDDSGNTMTITTGGSLAITQYADTPVAAQLVAGSTGQEFTKLKFAATDEDITISKLRVIRAGTGAADEDIAKVYVYHNGSSIGEGYLAGAAVNITLSPSVTIAKSTNEVLTLIADVNTVANGGTGISNDAPKLGLDAGAHTNTDWTSGNGWDDEDYYNAWAVGSDSGSKIFATDATSNDTAEPLYGNEMKVYATKLTASLSASSPSGTLQEGTREAIRLDLTCASNAGNYDCTLQEFTLAFSRNNVTIEDPVVYRADTGAAIGALSGLGYSEDTYVNGSNETYVPLPDNDGEVKFDMVGTAFTIPYGTTKAVYVKASLHYQGSGSTLSGSLQPRISSLGTSAATGKIAWQDSVYGSDITWVDVTGVSNIDGSTLTYTGGTDTHAPKLIHVVAANKSGGTAASIEAGDFATFVYSEPVKATPAPTGAANDVDLNNTAGTIKFFITGGTNASLGTLTVDTVGADNDSTGASSAARATTYQSNDSWKVTVGAITTTAVAISDGDATPNTAVAATDVAGVQDAQGNALSDITSTVPIDGAF